MSAGATLDIFNNDAFGIVQLTDAINNLPFVPGHIGSLGLFQETGVTTTTVSIEKKDTTLKLVAPSERGGPGETRDGSQRDLRAFNVPHFERNDTILADSVQNVRAFGQTSVLETVAGRVAERMQEHSQDFEATAEFARIGAIKGTVTYADGSTLNLFTEFGVAAPAAITFNLATDADGLIREKCTGVIRAVANELGGTPFSGIHCFAGDEWFDELIKNEEVRASYLAQQEARELRAGYVQGGSVFGRFEFGGILFENYRGQVGNTPFVASNKAHFFPLGVPGLFRTYYAPADYEETVNTVGQRLYVRQYPMANGKGRHLDVQTNALHICTRPRVLITGNI